MSKTEMKKSQTIGSSPTEQTDSLERVLLGISTIKQEDADSTITETNAPDSLSTIQLNRTVIGASLGFAVYLLYTWSFYSEILNQQDESMFLGSVVFFLITTVAAALQHDFVQSRQEKKQKAAAKLIDSKTTNLARVDLLKNGLPHNSVESLVAKAFEPTNAEKAVSQGAKLSSYLLSALATYYLLFTHFKFGEVTFTQVATTILTTMILLHLSSIVEKSVLKRRAARGADRYEDLAEDYPEWFVQFEQDRNVDRLDAEVVDDDDHDQSETRISDADALDIRLRGMLDELI